MRITFNCQEGSGRVGGSILSPPLVCAMVLARGQQRGWLLLLTIATFVILAGCATMAEVRDHRHHIELRSDWGSVSLSGSND